MDDEQGNQASKEDTEARCGRKSRQCVSWGVSIEEVRYGGSEHGRRAPDVESGAKDGNQEVDRGAGCPGNPEEGCGDANASNHARQHPVLFWYLAVMGSSGDVGAGEAVTEGGSERSEYDTANCSSEGQTGLADGELVGQMQDGGNGDKELEDGGEDEANIQAEGYNNGFGDQHDQWLDNRDIGHVGEGNAALSRYQIVWNSHSLSPSSLDLAGVGLRHSQCEEVGTDGKHERHPLSPAPATAECDNKAANEWATGCANEGGKC